MSIDKNEMLEWPIKVTLESVDETTGNVTLNVQYGEGFRDWFMKREGLKRWSEKRFQKVVAPILSEYYTKQSEARAVQSPPDGMFKAQVDE